MIRSIVYAVSLLAVAQSSIASPEVKEFLATYCIECHGEEKQKGERRFDELTFPVQDEKEVFEFQDIIDQLNLGDMPPRKAKQPSAEVKTAAIAALTEVVEEARESFTSTGGQTILRRLNRREYLNTVGDLFKINMVSFDPTTKFPRDQMVEHMDNIGDTLRTSGYLLDQYLDAADQIVEKVFEETEKPEVKSWEFNGKFDQGQELRYAHGKVYGFKYLCVYEVPNTTKHEGGYAAISEFEDGVHAEGYYEVQVLAHSLNRDHPYDPSIFDLTPGEPFRLGIVPGKRSAGILHHPQPIEPQLAEVAVRDGKPEWYTMRVWLEKDQTPRFIFPNGMRNCREAFGKIAKDYKDHWPKDDPYNGGIVDARRIVLQHGKMPHIRIHKVKVKGPLYDEWPPESRTSILGEDGLEEEQTTRILRNFADRAYRRPVSDEEVDRLVALVSHRRESGQSAMQALKDGLKAVICSPSFLYLSEPGKEELSPHDLASRLSYFLWATMPDEGLRNKADSGAILRPDVLKGQMTRLLADSRSDEFITGFLDSWLNLRSLGDMPPDRDTFKTYYSKDLQSAMKKEAHLFARHLIKNDRPITDFLHSDYTFVNRPLAEHYRIDSNFDRGKAHQFKRVNLTDQRRGGLLGMGAVLTVTANGIETSPIIRGVWLLENILGTPPSPPPDDVPAIDPDIRGAVTIREQLTKHRELETCYECHRKIDPPGFALENFDPVGAWRDHYPLGRKKGPEIDASSELASGEKFADIVEFKRLMLERQDLFSRMLTERLLTYATGRRIEPADRAEVEEIVKTVAEKGNGFQTLITEVVMSDIFRSP